MNYNLIYERKVVMKKVLVDELSLSQLREDDLLIKSRKVVVLRF